MKTGVEEHKLTLFQEALSDLLGQPATMCLQLDKLYQVLTTSIRNSHPKAWDLLLLKENIMRKAVGKG